MLDTHMRGFRDARANPAGSPLTPSGEALQPRAMASTHTVTASSSGTSCPSAICTP